MRLLVVDDDHDIVSALTEGLRKNYSVDSAFTGSDALYRTQINQYDAILLDMNLPDMAGIDVCSALRGQGITVPIVMVTGIDETADKVTALNAGADDYVTKPFILEELRARLRAVLRRPAELVANILTVDDLQVDVVNRTVQRDGVQIELRKKQFDLLEYLLRNKQRVVTRGMILEHVWDEAADPYSNTVDVHIKFLRDHVDRGKKNKLIHTVSGVGYVIGIRPEKG
jgi:DNA-binding response OmpR family regulator